MQPWYSHEAKPNDHLFSGESLHLFLAPLIQCFLQVCQEALECMLLAFCEGTESRVVSTNSNGSQILKIQQNSVKSNTTTLFRRMMNTWFFTTSNYCSDSHSLLCLLEFCPYFPPAVVQPLDLWLLLQVSVVADLPVLLLLSLDSTPDRSQKPESPWFWNQSFAKAHRLYTILIQVAKL